MGMMGIAGRLQCNKKINLNGDVLICGPYADIYLLSIRYSSKSCAINEYTDGYVSYWGHGVSRKYGPQSTDQRGKEGSYCGWYKDS